MLNCFIEFLLKPAKVVFDILNLMLNPLINNWNALTWLFSVIVLLSPFKLVSHSCCVDSLYHAKVFKYSGRLF